MKSTRDTSKEVELKLWLPPGGREKVETFPAFAAVEAEQRHELTTYFDTSELTLAHAGFSLRLRRTGNRLVQTLKTLAIGAGLAAQRGEWEWPVPSTEPVLDFLAETPAAEVSRELRGRLKPVFTTGIQRTVRVLQLSDGAVVEASLDAGVIETEGARCPARELELELKHGPIGPVYSLAISLHEAAWLRIDPESKASRGYRLAAGFLPKARKAAHLDLPGNMRAAEAFRCIMGAGLAHLVENMPPALLGDAEGVHQMRVAVRRLRSATKLFEAELVGEDAARFDGELRDLGRVLGEGRDWDVFVEETIPAAMRATNCKEADLKLLCESAAGARDVAHKRIKEVLESPAFTSLVLRLAAWAEKGALRPELLECSTPQELKKLAPKLLGRMAKRVRKRGSHITRRSGEELHALRKALKKLRYGAEYFSGLYPRKAAKQYRDRCEELQTLLGAINDANMTPRLAKELVISDAGELHHGIAALVQWTDARRIKAMHRLKAAWKDFRSTTPPWQ
jgi:inorganic triphosphatase YgiF